MSPSTVSELNQKLAGQSREWRQRPITSEDTYVFLDGIWLTSSWGGEVKNVSTLVTFSANLVRTRIGRPRLCRVPAWRERAR